MDNDIQRNIILISSIVAIDYSNGVDGGGGDGGGGGGDGGGGGGDGGGGYGDCRIDGDRCELVVEADWCQVTGAPQR